MLAKFNSENARITQDLNGNMELIIPIPHESKWAVKKAKDTLSAKITVSISKYRNKRSLQQNNLLWALLELLGRAMGQDAWECYLDMLEEANAKYQYIECLKDALPDLKEQFRSIKEIEERKNGKTVLCKCFIGSSKFTTDEMTDLIEKVFDKLAELGVDAKDQAEVTYLCQEYSR